MERQVLNNIFGNSDIVELFSHIDAYVFKYKPEAKELFGEEYGVDDGTNVGIMAQELEKNPVTENAVKTDEDTGYKVIETNKLTAANSAVISELCKRVLALEALVEELKNGR